MRIARHLAACLCVAVSLAAPPVRAADDAAATPGAKLYGQYCSQCHGEKGDGQGHATPYVLPRPRDFTKGKYKIRSTPSGALPTDDDLRRIIRDGMPYTAMPAWPEFSDAQVDQLIAHLKTFSAEFANPERKPKEIDLPGAPSTSEESVARGRKVYEENGCAGCHGDLGRADGASAPTLKDDWGNPIRPADLTKPWTFRGGASREDVFRAFSTGLNGTPMPSYADSLTVDQRWDLVNYIDSLSESDEPDYANVLVAARVTKPLELSDAELFEEAQVAYFPMLGQVIQPGRSFHPVVTGIETRAVYNENAVAIELRWHDMRADKSGANAPNLPVPPEEDHAAAKAAAPAAEGAEGGDPWGDAVAEEAPAADPWAEEAAPAGGGAAEFSDAVAIQLPVEVPRSIRKPYFLFGDKENGVHLWFVDLAKGSPELWVGRGSDALEKLGPRDLEVTTAYDRGRWTVRYKRELRVRGEIAFDEGLFVPIAFSVWDGLERERGNKRAITGWWTLYFEPSEAPSPVGAMVKWALGVLLLEVAFIGWARRRNGAVPATHPSPSAGGSDPHV